MIRLKEKIVFHSIIFGFNLHIKAMVVLCCACEDPLQQHIAKDLIYA